MASILVVEDEVRLANALGRGLESHGWEVSLTYDGQAGYDAAKKQEPDVIVLDIMLPRLSGMDVCRRLRAEDVWTPILALTAMDTESDEAEILTAGADDYLRKPFSYPVLLARCSALLRRGGANRPEPVQVGDLSFDPTTRIVQAGALTVTLTRREAALLEFLMRHAGRACSKEEILRHVWGSQTHYGPNVVEVYVGYLRRKLDRPHPGASIRTLHGQGYLLEAGRDS